MPKTRQQKEESVHTLTDKLGKAKAVVFANFTGMTMSQLSSLRKELRTQSAEFSVTKNNLLKLALQATSYQLPAPPPAGPATSSLEGPTATLLAFEDEIAPLKVLSKALKDAGMGEIKAGFLNGEFLDADKVKKLSTLPGKDELRGKVVGTLGAPLYGIVGVLQANLRNFVYALDQIRLRHPSADGDGWRRIQRGGE